MSRSKRPVARVFPPGDFLREELEARGWTQRDLAEILDRPIQAINAIINGKKEITPETAVAFGAAFGTSPEFWLNLESAYRLAKVGPADPAIKVRAQERSQSAVSRS
jgi:HTH-type transcriptional regulator/antitoxin HigA